MYAGGIQAASGPDKYSASLRNPDRLSAYNIQTARFRFELFTFGDCQDSIKNTLPDDRQGVFYDLLLFSNKRSTSSAKSAVMRGSMSSASLFVCAGLAPLVDTDT